MPWLKLDFLHILPVHCPVSRDIGQCFLLLIYATTAMRLLLIPDGHLIQETENPFLELVRFGLAFAWCGKTDKLLISDIFF